MWFAVVLLASLVLAAFLGHVVHWSLHQRWSGIFNRGHMEHHTKLYPPGDLLSDAYRKAAWYNNGIFLFAPAFLVISIVLVLLTWALGAPAWVTITMCGTILWFGLANDLVHDAFHVRDHWLERFSAFREWRRLHFIHHSNMRSNFGIYVFVFDRVFKTMRVNEPQRKW